ncbi:MAG TPA: T9SS type A sorting domain-containing protein [Chitinophagales bacterium]|nr:T9SS type A sorting domain-containing protein [Chitinophagales bacterium]HMW12129.1 T9SS type A sorting domain-containing protein [Chitinophagales bacterium]HMX59917.1 T9SS type A sorting domain-containing protein [Chitinophagales bacterium]HMZ33541.1 T9SS type A sorting domain-containing protein [Chitinophagales bacterium]HNB48927.1 T9SS type A sorting domain-containing protein [Chitinophagales bacterium]
MVDKIVNTLKIVNKPMRRTFTLILLLFASSLFFPRLSQAFSVANISAEAKFGEKDLIKLYPNPMTTDATIKISSDIDVERSKVAVVFYNMIGSEVYRIAQVKEYDLKINRDIFKNAGIYFFQLKIDESVVSTGRITVK